MEIAITYRAQTQQAIIQEIKHLLAAQTDGTIIAVSSAKGPALLAQLSSRSLQRIFERCKHTSQSVTAHNAPWQRGAAPGSSNYASNAAEAPAGPDQTSKVPSSVNGDVDHVSIEYTAAEAVLLAISCLEMVKASSELLLLLRQHGYLKGDHQHSSSSCTPGRAAVAAGRTRNTVAEPVAVDAVIAGSGDAGGRSSHGLQQQQQQHEQHSTEALVPLLMRCGIVTGLVPVHDPSAMYRLRTKSLTSLLAPAEEFRCYLGNQVGFYFSFLNAMTIWLLAPAAVSTYLMWALHTAPTGSSSSGNRETTFVNGAAAAAADALSSPFTPFLVVFHLLWSVIGLKLWRRQESGLMYKWHSSSSAAAGLVGRTPAGHQTGSTALRHEEQAVQIVAAAPETAAVVSSTAHVGPLEQWGACSTGGTGTTSGNVSSALGAAGSTTAAGGPAAAAAVVGRSGVTGPHDGELSGLGGSGLTAASLEAPAAAGVRWQYVGHWFLNPVTRQMELRNPEAWQLLRLATAIAATGGLLVGAAAVLLYCLNLQGYIPPHHSLVFVRGLAATSQPGGWFSSDSGLIMSQVPLVVRSLAVVAYSSYLYGPAAQALTGFENHRTLEGFAASLTAKQAALQVLFTFGPVTYVGLAGSGAAAARAEVAAFFKVELLRRIVMELLLPWAMLWLTASRRKGGTVSARYPEQKQLQQRRQESDSSSGKASAPAIERRVAAVSSAGRINNASQLHASTPAATAGAAEFPVASTPPHFHNQAQPGVASRSAVGQALLDLSKPKYDAFTDFWDLSRDLGYLVLFAAVYPAAAPLCLLFSLLKVKQDCLKLLLAYQRPVPLQLNGIGSWNVVLTVQVFAAVLTNVFLSGLSTGQLVQLLPAAVVPSTVREAVLAAAAHRPTAATAASQIPLETLKPVLQAGPALRTLQGISSSAAVVGAAAGGMCANPASLEMLLNPVSHADGWCKGAECLTQYGSPTAAGAAAGGGGGLGLLVSAANGGAAAADHLLLLFVLEHAMVIVMVVLYWCIPGEPAVVRKAGRQKQLQQDQPLQQVQEVREEKPSHAVYAAALVGGVKQGTTPMNLHENPLFDRHSVQHTAAPVLR